jgi:hypothetical protein
VSAPVSVKAGVSIVGVSPEMAFGMVLISGVFQERGVPCVVTACTDGKHSVGSLHYVGAAVDIRLPSRFTMNIESDATMRRDLAVALGDEWDVILEVDHLHIEHDVKKSRRIA